MCSFGSCQTRFKFLSQFRKVRNAFECFVAQVQTRLPKTKCVWPMKIDVICTVSENDITVSWCPGLSQLADVMTKKGASNLKLCQVVQTGKLEMVNYH